MIGEAAGSKRRNLVKLVLGTAQLSRSYGVIQRHREVRRDNPKAILRAAESVGFVALDTSPLYGEAEKDIGFSGTTMAVFTKLDPERSVEDSLLVSFNSLKRPFLEGVYLHEEFVASDKQIESLRILREYKSKNKIDKVGVSIYSEDEFHMANSNPDVDIIQLPYNIFDSRFSQSFLRHHLDETKTVYARSIFLQGLLLEESADFPANVSHLRPFKRALEEQTSDTGLGSVSLALAFVLENRALSGMIVGSSSAAEIRDVASSLRTLEASDVSLEIELPDRPSWVQVDPRNWSFS